LIGIEKGVKNMNKCVCDICGLDSPQRAYKIKERKLMHSCTSDMIPIIAWERVDICDDCFKNLVNLRYEKSLEDRIDTLFDKYEKRYPDDVNLKSAYLQGIQDVIDLLVHNKAVKSK
jgi:predicted ATP-binding protein involved in virulence